MAQKEFTQFYPQAGWVEQDPMEIYASQYAVMMEAITQSGIEPKEIAAIGITNQRETTIVWDKHTGKPIHPAIVWQCRRTASICEELEASGWGPCGADLRASDRRLFFRHQDQVAAGPCAGRPGQGGGRGPALWHGGHLAGMEAHQRQSHVTDYTNASRTMLFDIHKLCWDPVLLKALDIPACMLPQVVESSRVYGYCNIQGHDIPIAGIAGDQQAALFGQCCFDPGEAKNTYGTGCFLLMNTGEQAVLSKNGLITTIAAGLNGRITYALEGSVFVGGAVIQWLRDQMRFFQESQDAEYFAGKVADTGGVYLVPAFTGLGAPGGICMPGASSWVSPGVPSPPISSGRRRSPSPFKLRIWSAPWKRTLAQPLSCLRADGGASRDGLLMQFQADILGKPVLRPVIRETTALGAAYLAGLAVGLWKDLDTLRALWQCDVRFNPAMPAQEAAQRRQDWQRAVARSMGWAAGK